MKFHSLTPKKVFRLGGQLTLVLASFFVCNASTAERRTAEPGLSVTRKTASVATPEKILPLDTPLTAENSVLINFGSGIVRRVPRVIIPGGFDHLKQPIDAFDISMVFWFPDMISTHWEGDMITIFKRASNKYEPQTNRFRVNVVEMYYSTEQMAKLSWKPGTLPAYAHLRPSQMLTAQTINANNYVSPLATVRDPSPYTGLSIPRFLNMPPPTAKDIAYLEKVKREETARGVKNPDKLDFVQYVESEGLPFELLMLCRIEPGDKCDAYVFDKKAKFQYRMFFPSEAVLHTEEIITKINLMLENWNENLSDQKMEKNK